MQLPKRRAIAVVLACVGVGVVIPAGVALSQSEPEQPTLGPEQPAAVPQLSIGAQVAAANVMAIDPALAGVLGAAQPAPATATERVTPADVTQSVRRRAAGARTPTAAGVGLRDIGVWSDEAGRAFGVELTIGLPSPVTVTADWPTLADPGSEWTAPTVHYTARNVRALTIDVDLGQGKVVNVEPDPDAEIEPPPGTELPAPHEDEGA